MNGLLPGDIQAECSESTSEEIRHIAMNNLLAKKNEVDDYLLTNCKKYLGDYKLQKLMVDVERAYQNGVTQLKAIMVVPASDGSAEDAKYPLTWTDYCPGFIDETNYVLRFASFDIRLFGLSAAGVYIPLDFVTSPLHTDLNRFHAYVQANIDEQFHHASRLLASRQRRAGFINKMAAMKTDGLVTKMVDLSQLGNYQRRFNIKLGMFFAQIRLVSICFFS